MRIGRREFLKAGAGLAATAAVGAPAILRAQAKGKVRLAYLQPAIAGGVLEMTIPDKPTSRLQKYRLTAKGNDWLAAQPRKKTK